MHMLIVLLVVLLAVGRDRNWVPGRGGVGVVVLIKVGQLLTGLCVADHGIILMWALNKLIS